MAKPAVGVPPASVAFRTHSALECGCPELPPDGRIFHQWQESKGVHLGFVAQCPVKDELSSRVHEHLPSCIQRTPVLVVLR